MSEKCFCHLNGLAVKDATARRQIETLKQEIAELRQLINGGETEGYTVDFSNTDCWARWSTEEQDQYKYGSYSFEINGTVYSVEDITALRKFTGVTSFRVRANEEIGNACMYYTIDGESLDLPFSTEDIGVWQDVAPWGDVVVTSFEYESCLTGDSLITMADGTEKRIDALDRGDYILAYNPESKEFESALLHYCNRLAHPQYAKQYDIWTFEDGTIVKTAKRHRLYNVDRQSMVYMDEWQIGERAYSKNGEYIALMSHEVVEEEIQHFTLFCRYNNYFVNGVLAGNRFTPEINL